MPSPSVLHYDSFLSQMSVAAFEAPRNDFKLQTVFPTLHVPRQSDKYRIWDDEAFLRDDFEALPYSTESAGTDFTLSSSTYYATRYALHYDIDVAERKNTDGDLDLDMAAVNLLVSKGRLKVERTIIANLLKTGVWGTDIAGTVGGTSGTATFRFWSDTAASNPILDMDYASDLVLNATGLVPNTLVVSQAGWRALQRNPNIASKFIYVKDASSISEEMVAAVLGVNRVIVVNSIRTSNIEGATKAKTANLGKVAWLGYVPDSAGLMSPTPAAIFAWDGVAGMPGISDTVPILKYFMDEIHSDRIEAFLAFDVKATAPTLGVFMSTVTA